MKKINNGGTIVSSRPGIKDVWNAFMTEGATYELSNNDILTCHTTAKSPPRDVIDGEDALDIYNRRIINEPDFHVDAFVSWFIDDRKFDYKSDFSEKVKKLDIWMEYDKTLAVLRHFAGAITPDFSTYQDMPYPVCIYNTYRSRAYGHWLGRNGIAVINSVRGGTKRTFSYCFDGIPRNDIVCIGSVGGNPHRIADRQRFNDWFFEMLAVLHPHTILTVGSDHYECFDIAKEVGITVISYPSGTARAFMKGGADS